MSQARQLLRTTWGRGVRPHADDRNAMPMQVCGGWRSGRLELVRGGRVRRRRRALAITSTAPSSRGRLRAPTRRSRARSRTARMRSGRSVPRRAPASRGRRRLRRRPRRPGSARGVWASQRASTSRSPGRSRSSSTTVPPGTSGGSMNGSAGAWRSRGRRPRCPGGWPVSGRLCGTRRLVVSPCERQVGGEAMELKVGNRVEVEGESPSGGRGWASSRRWCGRHLSLAIAFAGTTGTRASTPLLRARCIAPGRARRRSTRADRRAQEGDSGPHRPDYRAEQSAVLAAATCAGSSASPAGDLTA